MNKESKLELINGICLVAYVVLYLAILVFFEDNHEVFMLRHIVLFVVFLVSVFSLVAKCGLLFYKKIISGKSGLLILGVGILFAAISLIKATSVSESFSYRTVVQIGSFMVPMLYALNLINLITPKKMVSLLEITTLIVIAFYFMEPNHTPLQFFNIENWKSIDILKSRSFTESHICAETFLQLFLSFYYIHSVLLKKASKAVKKRPHIFMVITFIFTILSFKRLGIVFVALVVLGGLFINYKKHIKFKYKSIILASVITGLVFLYYGFLNGTIFHGANVDAITTNRGYILSLWRNRDYYSYGYGTSYLVMGRYLEMDLVQILIELNGFSLWLFCFVFFKSAGKRLFPNIVVLYVMLNMMSSSTMPWTTGWLFFGLALYLSSTAYLDNIRIESKRSDMVTKTIHKGDYYVKN